MRKVLSFLIIPVLLIGCAKVKEAEVPQEQDGLHEVIFHASWDPETRTALQEDGSVWWTPGDQIALFDLSGNKYCLTADCEEPSPKTDFVGKIGNGSGTYYAIYPYDKALSKTEFSIPSVQYAKSGGFAPGQFVSFAKTDDDNLTFYNLCTGIKFSVAHDGISKIVFKYQDNWYPVIAGNLHIVSSDPIPDNLSISADYYSEGLNPNVSFLLTVYPSDNEYFTPGEYYYASIMPAENASLVISFYTDTQVATASLPVRSIERSKVGVLREIDTDLTFEDFNYTYSELGQTILPEGIDKNAITEVVFHTSSDKTTSTVVPSSIPAYVQDYIPVYFELQGTTAHYYTKAERYMMTGPECVSFRDWRGLRSVDLSMFSTRQVREFQYMFEGCVNLESVNLSSFNSSNVWTMQCMFTDCKKLKNLDLSNFTSRSLDVYNGVGDIFFRCYELVKLDLGNFDLSACFTGGAMGQIAKFSKNCAIRCTAATRDKLSDNDSRLGSSADYITWVLPGEELPDLEPLVDPNLYVSTDFSKDKTVRILHKATTGNGVDIVLLGDAYSDRMIADGTYDADMELAMNAIFKDEPYASFQDYFNVFTVYAVSENEIPYDTRTVFDAAILHNDPVNGTLLQFDQEGVYQYASIAFPNKDLEDVAMIVIINQAEGEGSSFTDGVATYETVRPYSNVYLDYAAYAKSVGMINRRDRSKTEYFSNTVAHEFGHVFAKLGDEYVMYDTQIPDWERNSLVPFSTHLGWWSNIDITSDPNNVKWKKFLEDERYVGTGIGIYEGGYTYQFGVWRPTENSIMRYNQGMFNAPSREVIYKRIHKLALSKDWQYDYETFVEYDQKNIAAEKAALSAPMVLRPLVPDMIGKPFMKIEKSVTPDGKERISVIMN